MGSTANGPGHASPYFSSEYPPFVRSLRLAPTVSAFLAVAGDPMLIQSTNPACDFRTPICGSAAVPSLPAEMTMSMSLWLYAKSSTSSEFTRYDDFVGAPQLLLWIRAPR